MEGFITIIIGLIGTVIGVILTKVAENFFEKKKEAELFIADIDEVLSWGWDGKKLLRHLIALDYETTDNLNEENEGTPNQWSPVFMNNPDCWRLLAIRRGELVGYWNFFALEDNFFNQVKQGLITDSEITIDNVKCIDAPGTYNIYIVIFCIKEHYRRAGFKLLIDSFINKLNELTDSDRKINEICVNAFSDVGEIMSRNFGLRKSQSHKEFGIMYLGTFNDVIKSRAARGKLRSVLSAK